METGSERKEKNSSLFKVDVVVYPEVSLKNLVITQVYQVLLTCHRQLRFHSGKE